MALALAFAAPAGAQEIVDQDATVINGGVGVANSGGNAAVGNTSTNVAVTSQTASGFLGAVNAGGGGGNTSNGSASVTTGSATAVGNSSDTKVTQAAATGNGTGPSISSQDATVVNGGIGVANTGGNVAIGNGSTNVAVTDQDATGVVATNTAGGGGNTSNGTATIVTGAATGIGNDSDTTIGQAAVDADGDGILDFTFQDATVVNLGAGVANSGLNFAEGNDSVNLALTFQDATGLVAANTAAGGGNNSNGTATITTGAATGIGTDATTVVDQGVARGAGSSLLSLVDQDVLELNLGAAVANSGLNFARGNDAFNLALLVQNTAGLVVTNVNPGGGNTSNGTAGISTGAANAAGTKVITAVRQRLA